MEGLKHMHNKRHCKILYKRGVDMEEYEVFYVGMVAAGGSDGVGSSGTRKKKTREHVVGHNAVMVEQREVNAVKGGDEEEWENVSDDNDTLMNNSKEDQ